MIKPMLATLCDKPFDSKEWLFEIKWDGYRALASKNKKVKLTSRNDQFFNARFPHIVEELELLPGSFVVDGEIVMLDASGRSNFQLLQNFRKKSAGMPLYYLFDILSYGGKDLTGLPLVDRKLILQQLLGNQDQNYLRYSDHVDGKGKAFFRLAQKNALEGIMAKKKASKYRPHRSTDWLKIKTKMRQEVVIGGFTEPRAGRSKFGALLVGVYEQGKLIYAGHVGGGFTEDLLAEVFKLMSKLIVKKCPFEEEPRPNAPAVWIKPKLICEVAFAEWTDDGIMRQPIFKGLRTDKSPKEVVRERAQAVKP